MRCPKCNADRPRTVETRRLNKSTRRTKRCRDDACGHVWETLEVLLSDRAKRQLHEKGEQLDLRDLLSA